MKIAIFAAGTGGHIYPALSIAEKFGKENVIFIASNREIERKIYKNSGFKVSHLNISGFRGKNFLEKILWPLNLASCVLISIFLLIKYRPQNVLLMGNYISVIGLIASIFLFKDIYIHEQNAILGSANKFSLIFAKKLFTTFPLNEKKEHNFGQPVRSAFNTLSYATHSEKEHILVLGGSQGALFFNNQLSEILGNLNLNENIEIQYIDIYDKIIKEIEGDRDILLGEIQVTNVIKKFHDYKISIDGIISKNNIQIAKLSRATIISVLIEDIAPAIKQIKISGETKRSSSNTFTDNEFKLFKKDIIGFEVSLGNAAKPKPAKIEPVITLRV